MLRIFCPRAGRSRDIIRGLGLAAIATLVLWVGPARRAEALTLINPASSSAAKAAADGTITAVRHGGGFHGGGFHGGGGHIGGFHGGHVGGFRAAPVYRAHIGGYRYGGYRYGGYHRYGGYRVGAYYHRHHYFHRRFYYGGYYPYYSYPRYHRCRVIWTYYGPRRVCRWHRWHRWGYRPYW